MKQEPKYAIDIYKKFGSVKLDINEDCMKDVAFSTDLKVGDSCEDCEFCLDDPVYIIGGMLGAIAGYSHRCEKGYWKEDV